MKLVCLYRSAIRTGSVALLALICGCGGGVSDAPKLAPAQGTVTWQGKGLNDATVIFTPQQGPIAIGSTDGEGRFSLLTQGRPGASLGEHSVTISAFEAAKQTAQSSAPKDPTVEMESTTPPVSRIPAKFNDPRQSNLKATVKENAGENTFQFDLK